MRSLSSETRLDHSGKPPVDGWKWRRGAYSGRDSSEHVQDLRRVAWRRPPSFRGRGVAGTRGIGGAQQDSGVRHGTAACAEEKVASVRLRTCPGRHDSARRRAGRIVSRRGSIGNRRVQDRQQERRSVCADDDTHAHNTLSPEDGKVQVFYPFHPLQGATVQILRRPKREDGAVSVIDRSGKRLKIPVWMLSPETAQIMISEQAHLSKEALLSLASLLSLHAGENRGHDNLLSTAVKECQGGHRGATGTIGPEDSGRKRNRARGCNRARRCGRSDGSDSDGGFSSGRRKD